MKENILGPRQWAFVVITGGAACALPFLQTDNPPTRTDSSPTSSQQDASLDAHYTLGDIVPPLHQHGPAGQRSPAQHLPEWANANRSPFDDIVGNTAAQPQPAAPQDQLPMQPQRPWIAGPGETASQVTTSSAPHSAEAFSPSAGTIARSAPSTTEASPWSDEATGFTPIEQLASNPLSPLAHDSARGSDASAHWPDQAVSREVIAQQTRSRDRELASAIVARPQNIPNPSSNLLAEPALPPPEPPQTVNTVPVAAQRSGQAYMPPSMLPNLAPNMPANMAPTQTVRQGLRTFGATAGDAQPHSSGAAENDANLPSLPTSRKSHVIFQPGIRK